MAEERRNSSSRGGARPGSGSPQGRGSSSGRGGASRDDRRAGSGRGSDSRGSSDRRGGDRPARKSDWKRPADQADVPRSETQARYDGPPLPEEVTGRELDKQIGAQLKGLPEKLANRVARHLVAADQLIETDPETAYQHTLAARARAARLAVIREAVGEAAYAAGHYKEALTELRAAKRMNGATAYLPIMADCHRALGQPDQALKLAKSPSVAKFAPEAKAEMTIVEAGAHRDLGNLDHALVTLERAPLSSNTREPWVVRLRYTYADTLEEAGRPTEALEWFHRTHAIDTQQVTDAAERAEALELAADKKS